MVRQTEAQRPISRALTGTLRTRTGTPTILLGVALCGATLGGGWQSWGSESPAPQSAGTQSSPRRSAVTNETQAAAVRGVDWLVAQKDAMPLSFALKNYEKFHRAAADEDIRRQMAGLIREKCRALPTQAPSIDLSDPTMRNWYALRPAVMDLIYLKSLGKPWKAEADKIAQLFAEHGEAILPSRATLSERLVAAYKLQILGVPTGEIYTNTLAEIRAQQPASGLSGGMPDMRHLYARTHIIFTASGYYSRYLDPAEFAPEIACFAKALEEFAGWTKMEDIWADLASEILIARKILRQAPDAHSEALRRRLLSMQNADGSWGSGPFSTAKVHHTAMAVLALMEFAPEFRVGIDYL